MSTTPISTTASTEAVFQTMLASFHPEAAEGVTATYQFDLTGPAGGQWWVRVADGQARLGQGVQDDPSVTFIASTEDYIQIARGELDAMMAFFQGRLKIKGDVGLATLLPKLFEPR